MTTKKTATGEKAPGHDTGQTLYSVFESASIDIDTDDVLASRYPIQGGGADGERPQLARTSDDRYEYGEEVGKGAMGTVLAVRDLDLRRTVAIKRMAGAGPGTTGTRAIERRFLTEAQVTAQLEHPNIVPVYALEIDEEGMPAYTMKLIQGQTLAEIVEEAQDNLDEDADYDEPKALSERLEHFLKVCDGMAYAHHRGVLHRDLKPDNIMVGPFREVYVMDWGIARIVGAEEDFPTSVDVGHHTLTEASYDRTALGAVIGTPRYMSPEQAEGKSAELDARSDVFSLGAILYELVTLRPAFDGQSVAMILDRVRKGLRGPSTHYSDSQRVPPDLLAIVDKALALEPSDRYRDVDHLSRDLRAFLRGEAVEAVPETPMRRLRRWTGRNQQAVMAAFAGLIVLMVFGAVIGVLMHNANLVQQKALLQAQEQAVRDQLAVVNAHARHVDARFLWFEGKLNGLAGTAIHAIQHGESSDSPQYNYLDYTAAARQPPDLEHSPRYKQPISLDSAMWKAAPGSDPAEYEPQLARLGAMTGQIRNLFLTTQDTEGSKLTDAQAREAVLVTGVPWIWAYMGIESTGLAFMYPGSRGVWTEAFDPRVRPWYRAAIGTHGPVWTAPYVDLMGQGVVLSCVQALYGDVGEFLGVAAIDLPFDFVIERLMVVPGFPAQRTLLLDAEGRVMVRSTDLDLNPEAPAEIVAVGVDTPKYGDADVVAAAIARREAVFEREGRMLFAAPVDHLGWTFVVETSRSAR